MFFHYVTLNEEELGYTPPKLIEELKSYSLDCFLGHGSEAEVYRARDSEQKYCVIKFYQNETPFQRERDALTGRRTGVHFG